MKNEIESNHNKKFFPRELAPLVKGGGIILMFALHVLKSEWMLYPDLIIDFNFMDCTFSAFIARSCDLCLGVFAFISGFGWFTSFRKKSKIRRLLDVYTSYYICYLFCLIARLCDFWIGSGSPLKIQNILYAILGISSDVSSYCWYVSFFALAVLTYELWEKIIDKVSLKPYTLVIMICFVGISLRAGARILYSFGVLPTVLLDVFSHYFQWMPVVVIGMLCSKYDLLDLLYSKIKNKLHTKKSEFILGLSGVILILFTKSFIQRITNVYSNFDSIIILPFMFFSIMCLRVCYDCKIIKWILTKLGDMSLFMWLTHCLIRIEFVQQIVYSVRIPLLILVLSLVLIYFICVPIRILNRIISTKLLS